MLGEILVIIILVLIIVIGYYIKKWLDSFPIINCGLYGQSVGAGCKPGQAEYAGLCYDDTWSAAGGTKTAICSVDYPGYDGEFYTNCFGTINTIEIGQSCSSLSDWTRGPNWWKSAVCTCQKGGLIVTPAGGYYCRNVNTPSECPADSDYFEFRCLKQKCPEGYKRTDFCTCTPISD